MIVSCQSISVSKRKHCNHFRMNLTTTDLLNDKQNKKANILQVVNITKTVNRTCLTETPQVLHLLRPLPESLFSLLLRSVIITRSKSSGVI